jgi:hypothetical protein
MFITFTAFKFLFTTRNTLFMYLPEYKASPVRSAILRNVPTKNIFNSVHNYKVTLHIPDDEAKKFLTYTRVTTVL